jgi:L-ascorbate metabolism protein UlaG (beta-lactamase superfamily)
VGILATMDAKEGLEMFNIINPKKSIPMQYNDYDVLKSPLEDFSTKLRRQGLKTVFTICIMEDCTFEINRR